jgi:hypothetical protein
MMFTLLPHFSLNRSLCALLTKQPKTVVVRLLEWAEKSPLDAFMVAVTKISYDGM